MVWLGSLTDEQCIEAVEVTKSLGSQVRAAQQLGISRGGLQQRLRVAASRGFMLDSPPAMPGFRVSQVTDSPHGKFVQQKPDYGDEFVAPEGHTIKGVSALLGPDGREIVKWVKTKEGHYDPIKLSDILKEAFRDYRPAAKSIKPPQNVLSSQLTLLPCNDWHVGMYAWGKETGNNWDLKIAEKVIGAGVDDVVSRSPASGTCIILGGGDLLHADNSENKTARSGNALQVDGRYQKVVGVAVRLMVRTVDAALRRHRRVIVRILPGNHDEHTAVAVAYFLSAWYRNEKRVVVDLDPSLFFWHRFGLVMIGATHGHTVKIAQMPSIRAHRRAEDWGHTKFRFVHGFHLHHSAKIATEGDGVICEVHQAPIPQDAWHFGSGFLSGRSLRGITYHKGFGEIGRVRTAILDAVTASK
jgi:hypothetical protein